MVKTSPEEMKEKKAHDQASRNARIAFLEDS